jgi:hypothetical protein
MRVGIRWLPLLVMTCRAPLGTPTPARPSATTGLSSTWTSIRPTRSLASSEDCLTADYDRQDQES